MRCWALILLGELPLAACILPGGISFEPTGGAGSLDPPSGPAGDESVEVTTTLPATETGASSTSGSMPGMTGSSTTTASTDATDSDSAEVTEVTEVADTGCLTGCEPGCGNGVVEGSEECDDGNMDKDDACSPICEAARVAFLTSVVVPGDFAMDSPEVADAVCQGLAGEARLAGMFRAWANLGSLPKDRFNKSFGAAYVRTDGVVLVDDGWPELSTGVLEQPLNVDEKGQEITGAYAWTGLLDYETLGPNCTDWTTTTMGITASVGRADSLIDWMSVDLLSCNQSFHLYCFQDEA